MTVGLPIGTYYLCACAFHGHLLLPHSLSLSSLHSDALDPFLHFMSTKCSPDWVLFELYSFWFFAQVLADRVLSGEVVHGQPMPELKGKRLRYKMNELKAWLFTHLLLLTLVVRFPSLVGLMVDRLYSILTVAQLYALSIALLSYAVGVAANSGCRLSHHVLYDFFMGHSRAPRIGDFDLKLFCEARPGLQLRWC